jgi:hypothetical protein
LKQAAEQLQDSGSRAARKLNSTFHLDEQGRRAQAAVSEGTAWVEQRLSVKRRLRLLAETVRQDSPKWRRQLKDFNESTFGQVFWGVVLVYSLYSGLFFSVLFSFLRIVFLISWFLPLLLFFSLRQFNGQMAAAQAQQRAAAAQQQQMGRNPFSGFGGGSPFAGFQQQQQQQRRRGASQASKPGPDFAQQAGGPIIDAEYETIDEGDK